MKEEYKKVFETLISFCESSGTFGERNDNGADSYCCPSCLASTNIKGYCSFTSSINAVEHEKDCELFSAYQFAKAELEKEETETNEFREGDVVELFGMEEFPEWVNIL